MEPNRSVICLVLEIRANARHKKLASSHDEFRGSRAGTADQMALAKTIYMGLQSIGKKSRAMRGRVVGLDLDMDNGHCIILQSYHFCKLTCSSKFPVFEEYVRSAHPSNIFPIYFSVATVPEWSRLRTRDRRCRMMGLNPGAPGGPSFRDADASEFCRVVEQNNFESFQTLSDFLEESEVDLDMEIRDVI
ncbi:hypothetical protein TNCV_154371 [Trichonephila clavipes]|uniref:Uncharacterized protein n=1 Tax=Trichonephila clavipes TaxID=2585209 RepID=A0A8X7BLQ4_TRICX|nr:hypothetical protein TNCV_154371 [Trichonephila clavipes]